MILLDFEGSIKGDSQLDAHEDWINLTSVSLAVSRSITTSAPGKDRDPGTASFTEVACAKEADIASNDIFAQAIIGAKICDMAAVHFLQTAGTTEGHQVFMEYELYEPIISSYSVSSGGERPSESFTISFTKIVQKYTQFDAGGTKVMADPKGYDLKTGQLAQ